MIQLEIFFEVSDHDGYCSGDESTYYSYTKIVNIENKPYWFDQLVIVDNKIQNCDNYDWSSYIDDKDFPKLNTDGSCYCDPSKESLTHGLTIHDYKITVINAILIS
jgi:hypothetical protein